MGSMLIYNIRMDASERVLVAIVNNKPDFRIVRDKHWYRIPVESAHKWCRPWPPSWLAFYQTQVFGDEAFAVNYFCKVLDIRKVYRSELFPDIVNDPKATKRYYQLCLGGLQRLPRPVLRRRRRRITFIPTTWRKLLNAIEINDLYHGSGLEDKLWAELRRRQISAERQKFIRAKRQRYALDFAVYCMDGKLAVETDGDTWHSDRKRIPYENRRSNDLTTLGWKLLRFNTQQIMEEMTIYCLPIIQENVEILGGIAPDFFEDQE
jgi:very-short-patch-repair endonuclease